MRVAAVDLSRRTEATVFTGMTAVLLHGLPVTDRLTSVEVLAESRGSVRRMRPPKAFAAPGATRRMVQEVATTTAPSDVKLWQPVPVQMRSAPDKRRPRTVVKVPVALKDGTRIGEVNVEALAPALAMAFSRETPRTAPPALDVVARRGTDPSGQILGDEPEPPLDVLDSLGAVPPARPAGPVLADAASLTATKTGRRRLMKLWDMADPLAESVGESVSRALMLELGFTVPELQVKVADHDGFIARVDCFWRERNLVGEFDGVGKYDVDAHASTAERRRFLRREQEREHRLGRVADGVVHWSWADLRSPVRFARLLDQAGVPRVAQKSHHSSGSSSCKT